MTTTTRKKRTEKEKRKKFSRARESAADAHDAPHPPSSDEYVCVCASERVCARLCAHVCLCGHRCTDIPPLALHRVYVALHSTRTHTDARTHIHILGAANLLHVFSCLPLLSVFVSQVSSRFRCTRFSVHFTPFSTPHTFSFHLARFFLSFSVFLSAFSLIQYFGEYSFFLARC